MNKIQAIWAKVPHGWQTAIKAAGLIAACALLGWWLGGCATPTEYAVNINPATGEGTAKLVKTGLVEPTFGIGITEAEYAPPPEGGWGPILLGVLAGIGGLQFAGPKSWSNWGKVLSFGKNSPSWGETGKALAANLGAIHSPETKK